MRQATRKWQKLIDDFNRDCKVGGIVNVSRDDGSILTTRTRSEAQMLGGHTPVVWVEGIAGAYLLTRVTILTPHTLGKPIAEAP